MSDNLAMEITLREQFKNGISDSDILLLMKETTYDLRTSDLEEEYVNAIKDIWAKELAKMCQEEVTVNVEKK